MRLVMRLEIEAELTSRHVELKMWCKMIWGKAVNRLKLGYMMSDSMPSLSLLNAPNRYGTVVPVAPRNMCT
jgi:hypothetical protein